MSRATLRMLRVELVRGAAPVAGTANLILGALLMYELAGEWSGWPGRWMPFAASVRMSLFVLGGLAVMFGTWQGGRERRRRIDEQLEAAARPRWQPLVLAWAAVTLGTWAALALIIVAGAALVAPVATYAGGGWWWLLAVSFPALAALSAIGVALGHLLPFRALAPVAGIVTYLVMVGVIDTAGLGGIRWLAPVLSYYDAVGFLVPGRVSALQALWFAGLAGTPLALVGTRSLRVAAFPAVVAAAGAVPLLVGPTPTWMTDDAALEPVCTDDGGLQVCLTRMNAFLLDDVTAPVREVLAPWEGIPGGPTRVVEDALLRGDTTYEAVTGRELVVTPVTSLTLTGDLAEPFGTGEPGWVHWPAGTDCSFSRESTWDALGLASAWSVDDPDALSNPHLRAPFRALLAMPEAEQKAWVGRVVKALDSCDEQLLGELATELR